MRLEPSRRRAVDTTARSSVEPWPASSRSSPLEDARRLGRTEEDCRRYLEELRWPEGTCCSRCESRSIIALRSRPRFYCRDCRHFFSLTSGTAFHNSHLPIRKWFLTIELVLASDCGLPANELTKVLGGSYATAWFVGHRIRAALHEAAGGRRSTPNGATHPIARTYAAALVGRHHQLGLKYLPAYEAERRWCARQRQNPNAFRDTVLALLHAEPLSKEELLGRGPTHLETTLAPVR
jgi:transposase-like protein